MCGSSDKGEENQETKGKERKKMKSSCLLGSVRNGMLVAFISCFLFKSKKLVKWFLFFPFSFISYFVFYMNGPNVLIAKESSQKVDV